MVNSRVLTLRSSYIKTCASILDQNQPYSFSNSAFVKKYYICDIPKNLHLGQATMVSTATTDPCYYVLRIPKESQNLSEFVKKFRDTKLEALRADPGSFVQRFEIESLHPLSVWQSRLNCQMTVLVCVAIANNSLSAEEALLTGEWVGFMAIHGPISPEDYYASPDMCQPVAENPDLETRWHVYDLYTSPAHRGRGVARKLGEAMLVVTIGDSSALGNGEGRKARLRSFVNPKSTWLVDEYKRFGFRESGRVTLKEGLVANGMKESVPEDTNGTEQLRTVWETRYGMAMERVIDIA